MDVTKAVNRKRSRRILELSFTNLDAPVVEKHENPKSQSLYKKVLQRSDTNISVLNENNISMSPSSGRTYQELTNVAPASSCRSPQEKDSGEFQILDLSNYPQTDTNRNMSSTNENDSLSCHRDVTIPKIRILEDIVIPASVTDTSNSFINPLTDDNVVLKPLNKSPSSYESLSNISVSNMIPMDNSFDEKKIRELLSTPSNRRRNEDLLTPMTKQSLELSAVATSEDKTECFSTPPSTSKPETDTKSESSQVIININDTTLDIEPTNTVIVDLAESKIPNTNTSLSEQITHEEPNHVVVTEQNSDSDDGSYHPSHSSESDDDITEQDSDSSSFEPIPETRSAAAAALPNPRANDEDEWIDINDSVPDLDVFTEECKLNIPDDVKTPEDFYRLLITDDFLDKIVIETNIYAEKTISATELKPKSRLKSWKPVDREEMRKFFGVLLVMGLVRLPRMNDYWSQNAMYRNNYIVSVMTRDRFQMILKFWHFSRQDQDESSGDKLYKIRNVLEMILAEFRKVVVPGKILVIDESMIPWRGRLKFRQYIKNKAHKYGVKLYKLCTPEGFTFSVIVYTGKGDGGRELNHGPKTVMRLIKDLEFKGRIVIADNFYNSIDLAEDLLSKKTFLCGTLRSNRKGLPRTIVSQKIKKGQIIGKMNHKGVRIIKWMDKRPVLMISTCKNHDITLRTVTKTRGERSVTTKKPECVYSYNDSKKGVDYSDQMSSYYSSLKRGLKWYRKVMMELIFGTALVNAWVLYNMKNKAKMPKKEFVEAVIEKFTGKPFNTKQESSVTAEPKPEHQYKLLEKKRRCTGCYEKVRQRLSSKEADKKVKKVKGFCEKCAKAFCLNCYNEKH